MTYTVVDERGRVVAPVEQWLEDLRVAGASPNTVKSWAIALGRWFTYLELRGDEGAWDGERIGAKYVSDFVGWLADGAPGRGVVALPDTARVPAPSTVQARLDGVLAFYRHHRDVHGVPVAQRLYGPGGRPRRARGLLAHLGDRLPAAQSPRVRVRGARSSSRAPVFTPGQVGAILEACARWDADAGSWEGNLRDRLLFATMIESGLRLGECLNLRVEDWHMGRGGTPYLHVVPRDTGRDDARVKAQRERRVYVAPELDQLFSDYLVELVAAAAVHGVEPAGDWPLFVNLYREPLFAPLRSGSVHDKADRLRTRGVGPPDWTPHWFRHTHATALLLSGVADWVVSRRLGHAHVQTTLDTYGWVTEDAALRAAANWREFAAGWPTNLDAENTRRPGTTAGADGG